MKNNNKQEKDVINITMNENEEMVYSKMGLDPILLLEETPISENYIVHIIRSGEEKVLKKEGNNKNIVRLEQKNPIEQDPTNAEEAENIKENENGVDLDEERDALISSEKIELTEKNELNSTETKENDDDPRRKRRRSSASS